MQEYLFFLLTGMLCALLISYCIKYGHEWGGDFALYISQSQSLIDGKIPELYAANRYSMEHSMYEVGPYLYPFGFPILICPLIAWKGIHFVLLKWLCAAFFIAAIPFVTRLFRNYFKAGIFPYIITCGIFLHSGYITFSDNVLSDLPFFLFCFVSLYVIEFARGRIALISLGILIFYTYFIRDIGIVLLPVLFTWQWIQQRGHKTGHSEWFTLSLPYITFAILFACARLFLPNGGENHFIKIMDRLSVENVVSNAADYFELISAYFHVHTAGVWIIFAFVLIGMISGAARHLHFIVFVTGSLAIVLIWPHFQGIRFLFGIIPFLLFFFLRGLIAVFDRQEAGKKVLQFMVLSGLAYMLIFSGMEISRYNKRDMNFAYTGEMKNIYSFISEHIPKDQIIGFEKPRVLRLFTGVNAILSDYAFFGSSEADLLLILRQHVPHDRGTYEIVYETENYYLLSRPAK